MEENRIVYHHYIYLTQLIINGTDRLIRFTIIKEKKISNLKAESANNFRIKIHIPELNVESFL